MQTTKILCLTKFISCQAIKIPLQRSFNKCKYLPSTLNIQWDKKYQSTVPQPQKENSKNCNVGTIGHIDHGKTTLTSAITKVSHKDGFSDFIPYDSIDKTREEKARGITVNASHIGYNTSYRSYAHTDCPGHADYIRNMISGTSQMDCAIVVVAATDGPMPQTKEHLLLAKQIGVKKLIVFINKADLVDSDILELVEIEMRELLEYYGYDAFDTPFVVGSALLALNGDTSEYGEPSIRKLMKILDEYVTPPVRDLNSPFLMPIDNVFTIPGRGSIAVGTIQRGIIKKNSNVNLMGFGSKLKTTIADIQIFRKSVLQAEAGDNIGMLLRGLRLKEIERGMVICAANTESLSNVYTAEFYLLSASEGGRHKPIPGSCYIQQLFSATWDIACRIDLIDGKEMLLPGDHGSIRLTLSLGMILTNGQTFTVRENNVIVGTGRITSTLNPIIINKGDLKHVVHN